MQDGSVRLSSLESASQRVHSLCRMGPEQISGTGIEQASQFRYEGIMSGPLLMPEEPSLSFSELMSQAPFMGS